MSDTINAGDLVMVVKGTPCCGRVGSVGRVFVVARLTTASSYCRSCGALHGVTEGAWTAGGKRYPVERLKKINPPAIGETREAYLKLKVPA